MKREFRSFEEFYKFYLSEHSNPINRRLHFFGCLMVIALVIYAVLTQTWFALIGIPVVGYGFAWIGHFFVEKNKPATFKYPLYSLMGDWVMFKDIITGRIKF